MKAKEVIILLLIILAGVGLHYLEDWDSTLKDTWLDDSFAFKLGNRSYEFEENQNLDRHVEAIDQLTPHRAAVSILWHRSEPTQTQNHAPVALHTARAA